MDLNVCHVEYGAIAPCKVSVDWILSVTHRLVRRGTSKIEDHKRTVGLHRFAGADKAKLKEQARTTRIAPTVMRVIVAEGAEDTRGRLHLVRWLRTEPYAVRI